MGAPPLDEAEPPDAAAVADAVTGALVAALLGLTRAERLAFILHDLLGVRSGDLAALLGCSPAVARRLLRRARRRVRAGAGNRTTDALGVGRGS